MIAFDDFQRAVSERVSVLVSDADCEQAKQDLQIPEGEPLTVADYLLWRFRLTSGRRAVGCATSPRRDIEGGGLVSDTHRHT